LDLGVGGRQLEVNVKIAAYYNVPPPDFLPMTAPLISGNALIPQTKFWIKGVDH
jgi:hypothetical protein